MSTFNAETSLGYLISKTNVLLGKYFNAAIKANGIDATVEQWGLLNIVAQSPGLSQTDIAHMGLKDKTAVTRMLDLLETKGYIQRSSVEEDRRVYHIYLTPKGENVLKQLQPLAAQVNQVGCQGLELEELEQLAQILSKVCNNIRRAL